MRIDIYGTFQRKSQKSWENVPSEYEFDRDYQLFAVLANVRNGYGYAGSTSGEWIEPISSPRGLPDDYDSEDGVFLGYCGHSYLSGDELLDWFENAGKVVKKGILTRESYEKWDKVTEPGYHSDGYYCGYVMGNDLKMIDDTDADKQSTPDWNYIQVSWTIDLKEEFAYFFNEVRRLKDTYGEIRFVFGFDC